MAGEGSMSSANQSLKQNRALLKRAKRKKINDLYLNSSEISEIEFKKVSPEELTIIKNNIRLKQKRDNQKEIIISIILIFIITAFFIYLIVFS